MTETSIQIVQTAIQNMLESYKLDLSVDFVIDKDVINDVYCLNIKYINENS